MMKFYNKLWEIRDKRVDGWPLMESVWPTLIICMAYMITSKFLGPLYMRNRAPYKLYGAIRLYNVIQVIASIYMFVNLMRYGWWNHYNWACQNVELSTNPDSLAMKMAVLCWWCYLSKILDFMDTFFFILRKKLSHISYLQVIHHAIMPLYGWSLVRFLPGGQETFGGAINAFVHILMYSYYFLSSFGPEIQKLIWWKRYLTQIQMLQFTLVFVKCCINIFGIVECGYPWQFSLVTASMMALFFALFLNFYLTAYKSSKKDKSL
ncbi:very long chain fatty acid elongase AAEL008004 [Lepeophtheirus salmonis]|uniref:Elongation of very long chain fatty acids protein n=1 Tax=Lepeophtheirus salmonis TaxID=72036 RepID=C1BTS6_LEPSM|nr:elongation of very long chain fatty acids protein AAEL008004-like [Lepeophtheirus salmonis]ACO12429.1 Elongation of very long chain fatty acids protein AAEL008004 [Lepeophtheirus salmonis]